MSLAPIGGALDTRGILALRAQILARNAALTGAPTPEVARPSFDSALQTALQGVNEGQANAGALSEAYERGDTNDIAAVMLARQKAAIGFEATLQVRNKLLSAYKDIMAMPV